MKAEECNGGDKIIGIYLIESTDIKSYRPLKLKRKYGKFKRKVTFIDYNKK